MKSKILITALVLSLSFTGYAQSVQKQVKQLDTYIQNAIEVWDPPGLAVAVVKDGKVVFTKGYGTRTIGKNLPVDEHTLFVCASTTKAFTAAGLAMLVDDGKIVWSDHVIDYLPEFQLSDPYVTRELTIRDLLTHRSGLGNTDFLWSWMSISGDSALYKLRDVDPSYSLRSSFIYQNLMYLAAGKVIEKVSGQSWESFLKKRIYEPLQMNETYAKYKMVLEQDNKADAHIWVDEDIVKVSQMNADEIGPAGSMWSSATDMAKWLQFLLNNGIVNGDTLIGESNFNELFKPQQIIPPNQFYPSAELTKPNWTTYGLGWFQHDYRGKMVQFHTGSLPGMVAIAGLIPEENIGVYVFGNLDHVELRHAIMYTVFDLFIDGKITNDWSADLKELYDKRQDDDEEPKRVADTQPTIPLERAIGRYKHQIYGNIEITKEGDDYRFNLNNTIIGSLTHWHYDTYEIIFDKLWQGKSMMSFRMDSDAELSYLEVLGKQFYYKRDKDNQDE